MNMSNVASWGIELTRKRTPIMAPAGRKIEIVKLS
jgi:hypothetical protein